MEKKTTISRDDLFLYFDGHLSEKEAARIMEWVLASEKNLELFKKERKLYSMTLLCEDKTLARTVSPKKTVFIRRLVSIAASVALAVGLTLSLNAISGNSEASLAMNMITVPAGERVHVTLSDGTAIWLNSGTVMEYPARFGRRGSREITVDGQANLDVTHDARHPFVVHTFLSDIKVYGTKFDVNASRADGDFETSLFEGSISISDPSGSGKDIKVSPSQKVVLYGGKLCLNGIDDYDVYRWTEGLYCFKDKRFSDIILDLERYYDKTIVYESNSALEAELLTGKFKISDGFEYAMEILMKTLPFTYSKDQGTGTIYIHIRNKSSVKNSKSTSDAYGKITD